MQYGQSEEYVLLAGISLPTVSASLRVAFRVMTISIRAICTVLRRWCLGRGQKLTKEELD